MMIDVFEGDVRAAPLDILILKFADRHHGADLAVASALGNTHVSVDVGRHRFVSTDHRIEAKEVLFLGVGALHDFDYRKIAEFSRRALELVALERPSVRHVGITLHGPGYGLDELASIGSLIEGLLSALLKDNSVAGLGRGDLRVSIVEANSRRAKRIREYLNSLGRERKAPDFGGGEIFSQAAAAAVSSNGTYSKRLFAAMPFNESFLDQWELAMQPAAHDNSVVIERLDHTHFTGDIVSEIRTRIQRSAAVVALLDAHNPNVFLEVGYAWGVQKPTILLLHDEQEPPFDVKNQRLIRYSRVGQLKVLLTKEIQGLLANATI